MKKIVFDMPWIRTAHHEQGAGLWVKRCVWMAMLLNSQDGKAVTPSSPLVITDGVPAGESRTINSSEDLLPMDLWPTRELKKIAAEAYVVFIGRWLNIASLKLHFDGWANFDPDSQYLQVEISRNHAELMIGHARRVIKEREENHTPARGDVDRTASRMLARLLLDPDLGLTYLTQVFELYLGCLHEHTKHFADESGTFEDWIEVGFLGGDEPKVNLGVADHEELVSSACNLMIEAARNRQVDFVIR